jgi:hypothetical protein
MGHDHIYGLFLRHYTPVRDPFLHEVRVRLFRRDRYWQRANRQRNPAKRKDLLNVSFTEQRLLEQWYPHTLRAAGKDWSAERRARAAAASRGGRDGSPVSRELLTGFTKSQAQATLGTLLLVVALTAAYDLRRRRRNMPPP